VPDGDHVVVHGPGRRLAVARADGLGDGPVLLEGAGRTARLAQ
jgi:hypothetical protein